MDIHRPTSIWLCQPPPPLPQQQQQNQLVLSYEVTKEGGVEGALGGGVQTSNNCLECHGGGQNLSLHRGHRR